MTLLLDSHALLWLTENDPRLGKAARSACQEALAADEIAVPTAVFFEIGWGVTRGRIQGPKNVRAWRSLIISKGLQEIPLSADIAMTAVELEDLHGDPFDRLIVATAIVQRSTLLTADRAMLAWPGDLDRRDARR